MGPFPLLLWVVVQTAWARIIPVKAALVLLACLVSTVACGDQIAATITGGNSGPLMSNDAGSADTGGLVGCPDGSLEFRALLFIKPQANVAGVAYAIDPADIDAATTGFGTTFVDWMTTLTNGRLCFVPEVSLSSTVLTTFSNTCDGGPGPWITDVADELKQLAPIGKYDSIFCTRLTGAMSLPARCGQPPIQTMLHLPISTRAARRAGKIPIKTRTRG